MQKWTKTLAGSVRSVFALCVMKVRSSGDGGWRDITDTLSITNTDRGGQQRVERGTQRVRHVAKVSLALGDKLHGTKMEYACRELSVK